MNAKNKKRIFEKITENQIWKIWNLTNESPDMDNEKLYTMLSDLIGIPSVNSLSKQESSFIIDKLQGCTKWKRPRPAFSEDKFYGDPSLFPTCSQIYGIRDSFKALGWSKDEFKTWLMRCAGVNNLDQLNRETAKKAYIGLTQIRIQRMKFK